MKTSRKGMLMAALICGTVAPVLFSGSAYAAEAEEKAADEALRAFELNPMVITAQKIEKSDLDTPAGTSVITAEEIERSGAKTAYEVIERQVGFSNKAYGAGGREFGGSSSRIMLRGLDKGTLVLVNGAPLNLENYNSTEGIPAQAIEKIEIVRGAQSAMYGAEAVGGVVNIITKKNGKNKTTISYGAGNFDQKWSLTTSGKNYMAHISKDYYGKVNEVNPTLKGFIKNGKKQSYLKYRHRDSSKLNGFVSVSPTDKLSIQYSHTEGKYYRDAYSITPDYTLDGGGTSYLYHETRDNASIIYDDKDNMFKTILSYNSRRSDPRSGSIKGFKLPEKMAWQYSSNWKLYNITWDTQKGWNFRNDKDNLIVVLNLEKDSATTWQSNTLTKKANRKSYALYASYKYQFTPKFSGTIGLRALHVDDAVDDNQNKLLPQFSTLYKASDNTSWYINVGKSFELPAVHDYYSSSRPDGVEQVKPQEGWTYETGVKVVNKANSIKFDIFHMDIDGKFKWDYAVKGDPKTAYATNAGKFKNTGVELEYTQKFSDKLSWRLGLMYANPKRKDADDDDYVQDEAKFQLTTGIDYQVGKFIANLNYLYLGKRQLSYYTSDFVKNGDAGYKDRYVPHRSLLNAAFTYKADDHNSMQLTFNNILGSKDTINEYESWGMPYNWMMTYNYTF